MKKISLALATAGLTASLGAFAALPTDAAPFQLVVPNLKSGLDITLTGLLLQPTNTDQDYATLTAANVSGGSASAGYNTILAGASSVQTVDPDYDFGFSVGLGYTFEDSGNDVQLVWTHFDQNNSDDVTAPLNSMLTSRAGLPFPTFNRSGSVGFDGPSMPGLDVFADATAEGSATSTVTTKLDSVDLNVGQFIDVGTRLRMRLFAGVRGARVSSDMSSDFYGVKNTDFRLVVNEPLDVFSKDEEVKIEDDFESKRNVNTSLNEQFNSKFTGIGPQVGFESEYHIGNCFGFVASGAVGLLVGENQTNTSYDYTAVTASEFTEMDSVFIAQDAATTNSITRKEVDTFTGAVDVESIDTMRVVPVLDAKLGLNYTHVFDNESVLTIEGGYQVTQYIDAVDRLDLDVSLLGFAAGSIDDLGGGDLNLDGFDSNGDLFIPTSVNRTTSSVGFNGPYLSLNWKV